MTTEPLAAGDDGLLFPLIAAAQLMVFVVMEVFAWSEMLVRIAGLTLLVCTIAIILFTCTGREA